MSEAEDNHITPRKPPVRLHARDVFAGNRRKFIETQRSNRPLGVWLRERRTETGPPIQARYLNWPALERRRLQAIEPQWWPLDGHWWQLGLNVDGDWRLMAGAELSLENWIEVREYISRLYRDWYDLEVWLDADECRARGLLPAEAATDARSDGMTISPGPDPKPSPIEPRGNTGLEVSPREDVDPPMPAKPEAQSLQKGQRKKKGYGEEDDNIARKLLTERGWLDDPAKYQREFWRLSKNGAPQLSGFGSPERKQIRLRDAIKRVTGGF